MTTVTDSQSDRLGNVDGRFTGFDSQSVCKQALSTEFVTEDEMGTVKRRHRYGKGTVVDSRLGREFRHISGVNIVNAKIRTVQLHLNGSDPQNAVSVNGKRLMRFLNENVSIRG